MDAREKLVYMNTLLKIFQDNGYCPAVEKQMIDDKEYSVLVVRNSKEEIVSNDAMVDIFGVGTTYSTFVDSLHIRNTINNSYEDIIQDTGSTAISDITAGLNAKFGMQVDNEYVNNILNGSRRLIMVLVSAGIMSVSKIVIEKTTNMASNFLNKIDWGNALKRAVGMIKPRSKILLSKSSGLSMGTRLLTADEIILKNGIMLPKDEKAVQDFYKTHSYLPAFQLKPTIQPYGSELIPYALMAVDLLATSNRSMSTVKDGSNARVINGEIVKNNIPEEIKTSQGVGDSVALAGYSAFGSMASADLQNQTRPTNSNNSALEKFSKAVDEYKNMRREGA